MKALSNLMLLPWDMLTTPQLTPEYLYGEIKTVVLVTAANTQLITNWATKNNIIDTFLQWTD